MAQHTSSRRRFVRAIGIGGLTLSATGIASAQNKPENFNAHLAGRNEVPPVDTNAQGQAKFQLSREGGELDFKLIVANIEDVVASHIHCAAAGENGDVGVTLFSTEKPEDAVTVNGVLTEGTITAPDSGNACGWGSLNDVVEAIKDGETYVNVHTLENPPGEIRGQIH